MNDDSDLEDQPPRVAGVLGLLEVPLGLGLLRLSTEGRPAEEIAIQVIHAALDRGLRLLDTADVYALDDKDRHYGERLARQAVETWSGPREQIKVLTKAGMARPKGKWVPSGRPEQLRKAVDGSLQALQVERLFLLQLHVRDPRVPFEETLAALAELQRSGKVEHLGLCNVSPAEVRQAARHFRVAVVQGELSLLQRDQATNGSVAFTRELGIPFLAYRPLGGQKKVDRLAKDKTLKPIADRLGYSPHEIALAAVLDAAPHVIPLFGATRVASVESSIRALNVYLDPNDTALIAARHSFVPSPAALAAIAPAPAPIDLPSLKPNQGPGDTSEVVVVMGMPGAGKSRLVAEYEAAGYARLNRDVLGGKLDDLVPHLSKLLDEGQRRVVLDNTYPTRVSRSAVIAAAHAHGVPVRCRFLEITLADAQYNNALRQLAKYGELLGPDEIKSLAKADSNLPPPIALTRWVGSFEPPCLDEGFSAVDVLPFVRNFDATHTAKGLLLDVDGTLRTTRSGELYPRTADDVELLPGRRETLKRWIDDGYQLYFVSNQSGIASGKLTREAAEAAFQRTVELLDLPVADISYCPHPAFPAGCFCRKPMPGMGVALIARHRLAVEHLVMIGDMDSDVQFAIALGVRYIDATDFFDRKLFS